MVRFTIYLEVIEKEGLIEQVAKNGRYLKSGLESLQSKHSNKISNVRNRGLFGAFDMPSEDKRDKALDLIANEGALMLGCGHNSIRFRPHLNILTEEIEQGLTMIDHAVGKL